MNMIHAFTLGDLPGACEDLADRTDICPDCGGLKSKDAARCTACHGIANGRVQRLALAAANRPAQRARRARFDEALDSGCYTLPELMDLARRDQLPTHGEILCRRWWQKTGETL